MTFHLARGDDVAAGVRSIATDQLDDAIDDLTAGMLDDPTEAIHDARKRCKKVRGLVRLVRPALGDDTYRVANDTVRDAARELSELRDATALRETFAVALARSAIDVDPNSDAGDAGDAAAAARATLAVLDQRHRRVAAELHPDHPSVERALALLEGAAAHVDHWELDESGWDAIGPGVEKTYERGRTAFAHAVEAPTGEHFHEWRKRVKYTWYHVRLLSPSAPTVLDPLGRALHDLSDALGDAHDMVVLDHTLRADEPDLVDLPELDPILRMLAGFRSELERRALLLGARLYAEPADAFGERLGTYWRAWHDHGDEEPCAEIADLWDAHAPVGV